jgi:predicted ABC-type ATPase
MESNKIQKPTLIVIAEPNGSGKTSITFKILEHKWMENCVYINPDNIAKDIFGDWNSEKAVLNAAIYCQNLREECLLKNESLIFETVLSSQEKVDFIKRAKEKGYFIRLFFVGTNNPKINASRIAQRVMEGGHDVPISKIISRYSKSIVNCCIVSQLVDRAYIYDNSIEYADPVLLFKISKKCIAKEYNKINEWAEPITTYLNNNL